MTGATHMLAAAAIYKCVPLEKPVVLVIALASHFLLDAIPHYELTKRTNYILGILIGVFLLINASLYNDTFLLVAAFLGALPDLNTLFFKVQVFQNIHSRIHSKDVIYNPWLSVGAELSISTVSIFVLTWH